MSLVSKWQSNYRKLPKSVIFWNSKDRSKNAAGEKTLIYKPAIRLTKISQLNLKAVWKYFTIWNSFFAPLTTAW